MHHGDLIRKDALDNDTAGTGVLQSIFIARNPKES